MEAVNPPFLGDQFRVEEYDDAEDEFYINPETHYINGMEWINLYCEPPGNLISIL